MCFPSQALSQVSAVTALKKKSWVQGDQGPWENFLLKFGREKISQPQETQRVCIHP
jgi:hypothetical protein